MTVRETMTKGTATYTEIRQEGIGATWTSKEVSFTLTDIGMSYDEEFEIRESTRDLKDRFETDNWKVIYFWEAETEEEIDGGFLINGYFYVPKFKGYYHGNKQR